MARLREFDEAKALAAVGAVFWARGYAAASYADLMAATGLGKGSLYAAFGDKATLYLRALAAYVDAELAQFGRLLASANSPRERIAAILNHAIAAREAGDRRGCFLMNAAVDRAPDDPKVEALVRRAFAAGRAALDEASGATPGAHFFAVFLGLRAMAKGGESAAEMRAARDTALAVFPAREGAAGH